jgi:predicted nucleic acid-binding protein
MSAVFADTSGLLALLNTKDENQTRAERAFATLRARQSPLVSMSFVLVDAVSFVTMRRRSLTEAFAFDPHFEQDGFSLVS